MLSKREPSTSAPRQPLNTATPSCAMVDVKYCCLDRLARWTLSLTDCLTRHIYAMFSLRHLELCKQAVQQMVGLLGGSQQGQ